jgi:hypothetical protein
VFIRQPRHVSGDCPPGLSPWRHGFDTGLFYVVFFIIVYVGVCFVCFCLILKIMYSYILCLCILIVMYVLFLVFSVILLFCVLLVFKCVLYYCHRLSTQKRLTKYITSHHIISYHIKCKLPLTSTQRHYNQNDVRTKGTDNLSFHSFPFRVAHCLKRSGSARIHTISLFLLISPEKNASK